MEMENLVKEVRSCTICSAHLPFAPKPILAVSEKSKILIVGQAPGQKVQDSGIPWNDQSGKELRRWLGVDTELFYNTNIFAIMPMGFCFPGTGKNGDLPPIFASVSSNFQTPLLSILFFATAVWSLAMVGNFAWNVTLSVVARLFYYAVVCASLIVLRRRQPQAARFRCGGRPDPGGVAALKPTSPSRTCAFAV